MEKGKFPAVLMGFLALIIIIGGVYVGVTYLNVPGFGGPHVSSSRAVNIIENDPTAAAYISDNFKVSGWRGTKITLIEGTGLLNDTSGNSGSSKTNDSQVWKVEIMERTCACTAPKDLYVVEGYVDADTGEILSVKTMKAPERNYEKETCASTACH